MSYIDRNLLAEEQIVFRTRKHLIIFFIPVVWLIATIAFLLYHEPLVRMAAIAPGFATIATGFYQYLDYITSEYAITNKRIIMKEGFFFRHMTELRLSTISNMSVNTSLLGQMLGYGTVIISPFGSIEDIFPEIANAYEFQKQTQQMIDKVAR